MKHVIIIETPDDIYLSERDRNYFRDDVVWAVENTAKRAEIACVVYSAFFKPSAVNAVCEMYGNDYRVGSEANHE